MANKKQNSVVLIEDDDDLRKMLHGFLQDEGFAIKSFADFSEFSPLLETATDYPDLFILDLMLPGKNGIEISQYLREYYQGPILIITAQDNELLEVTALNEGATSYLQKPIRPHLLLAHINALLRQFNNNPKLDEHIPIKHSALTINVEAQSVRLNDEVLNLSSSEFELIYLLYQHAGQIVSRDFILNNIRQLEYDGLDRSIDMRISSIRKKLNDTKPPYKFIKTVRGKGYIYAKNN